jgi:hypothetical protein
MFFNGATITSKKNAGSGFDTSYQAILDYATTNGITKPSASQQAIQNQLVLDLKSNGLWDRRYAIWIPANDGSAEFATLNWKNPALHRWTHPVGNVPFVSNVGFRFTSADERYIDTGFNWAAWLPTLSDMNDVGVDWAMNNVPVPTTSWGMWGHQSDTTSDCGFWYNSSATRGNFLSLNGHSIISISNNWQIYYRDEARGRIIWTDVAIEDTDVSNATTIIPTTTVNIPIGCTYRVSNGIYGNLNGWFDGDVQYFSIGDNLTTLGGAKATMKGLIESYLTAI